MADVVGDGAAIETDSTVSHGSGELDKGHVVYVSSHQQDHVSDTTQK